MNVKPKSKSAAESSLAQSKVPGRRTVIFAALTIACLSSGVFGVFFQAPRDNPFVRIDIADWRWWLQPHPHRALAEMPVVPIGTQGTFVRRPANPDWTTQLSLPPYRATSDDPRNYIVASLPHMDQVNHRIESDWSVATGHFADDRRLGWVTLRNGHVLGTKDGGTTWTVAEAFTEPAAISSFNTRRDSDGRLKGVGWASTQFNILEEDEFTWSGLFQGMWDGATRVPRSILDPSVRSKASLENSAAPIGQAVVNPTPSSIPANAEVKPIDSAASSSNLQAAVEPLLRLRAPRANIAAEGARECYYHRGHAGNMPVVDCKGENGFESELEADSRAAYGIVAPPAGSGVWVLTSSTILSSNRWIPTSNSVLYFAGPTRKSAPIKRPEFASARALAVDAKGANIWLVGLDGQILTSNDSGKIWIRRSVNVRESLQNVHMAADGKYGWASTPWRGEAPALVVQTLDGGQSWEVLSPRHMPAPWVFLALLVGFPAATGLALRARREELAARATQAPSISDKGVSDRPISWDHPDPLGFGEIARAVSRFLRNANTEPPLTIAITGSWGSGKSSLMNLVRDDLHGAGHLSVWFNAWHHQQEQSLLAALLQAVKVQATPSWFRGSGLMFRLRLLWVRSRRDLKHLVAVTVVAMAAVAGFVEAVGPANLTSASKTIASAVAGKGGGDYGVLQPLVPAAKAAIAAVSDPAVAATVTGVLSLILMLGARLRALGSDPATLLGSVLRRARISDLSDQLGFRHRFAKEFSEVCDAFWTRTSPGLVIFIDDLDRCQPGHVLQVLEAINFLVTAGNCVVIIGMDRVQVENCVAAGFEDSVKKFPREKLKDEDRDPDQVAPDRLRRFARRYMQKLVNLEIPVPEAGHERSLALVSPPKDQKVDARRVGVERRRRLMFGALDVCAALVPLTVLCFLAAIFVSAPTRIAETPQGPPMAGGGAAATPARAPAPATGGGIALVPTTSNAGVARVEQPIDPARLRTIFPTWTWPVLFATVVLGTLFPTLMRLFRRRDFVVEDSPDFAKAIAIWHPLVHFVEQTPRGIKRHQNRMRYFAMRLRSVGESDGEARLAIPEPTLVALGALASASPDLIDCAPEEIERLLGIWSMAAMEKLDKKGPPTNFDAPKNEKEADVIKFSRAELALGIFKHEFPASWPPTADQLAALNELSKGLRA